MKLWKNKRHKKQAAWFMAVLLILVLLLPGCGGSKPDAQAAGAGQDANVKTEASSVSDVAADNGDAAGNSDAADGGDAAEEITTSETVTELPSLVRTAFLSEETGLPSGTDVTPDVEPYTIDEDLGNVFNTDRYQYMLQNDAYKDSLAKNGFVIDASYVASEFFPVYESNRYGQFPNFVTVDSLMHTYHLAFALVLRKTEKEYLYNELAELSMSMFYEAVTNYEELKGTEWEDAAAMNVMFFAVGASLLGMDPAVPEGLTDAVGADLGMIMDASAMADSEILGLPVDFTQFTPRGYYEGDPVMEEYFRAMMWYGLVGFPTKNEKGTTETLTKAAALMTLELDGSRLESWEKIYAVTSFFAGASDDLTYYEMLPVIEQVYGKPVYVSTLAENPDKWQEFYDLTTSMRPPAINSMVTLNDKQEEVQREFRFMGQRYTVDAEMFQSLTYKEVGENGSGEKRMLPDTLDAAAAMGSDTAVSILEDQGDTEYAGYMDQVEMLRGKFGNEEDPVWSASLSASWLNTLNPLLREKGEGYPFFMQGAEWAKKTLETFAGSYAELKHDTVLYAKQMAVEMGGGDEPDYDDRGYVEPEPEIYARFVTLSKKTSDGLKEYGMLSAENEESLAILTELGEQLLTISEKELQNETLTDEEYELIRSYGGTIEHFWRDLATEITGEQYVQTSEFPAETIVDIATDQDSGSVLEIGVGGASEIYVIVPVDGTLRIATGSVYNFYQFTQPMSNRMTDSEWRQMIHSQDAPNPPEWTQSYRVKRSN